MNKLLILIVFIISFKGFSQKIDKELMTGTWRVLKVEKVSNNPNFKDLIKGFTTSTFTFSQNEEFKISTENKTPLFSMVIDEANQSKWKLGKLNKIRIGSQNNNFSIMHIIVKIVNEEVFFDLGEEIQFPLVLKVQKLKK